MSWKCICETSNEDEVLKCTKCNKDKPSYLGLGIRVDRDKKDNLYKANWLLSLAYDTISNAEQNLGKLTDKLVEYRQQSGKLTENEHQRIINLRDYLLADCINGINQANISQQHDGNASIEKDDNDINIKSLISKAMSIMGQAYFFTNNYEKALEYLTQSFAEYQNQVALYYIALTVQKMPVEGKGVFTSGSKKEMAERIKREEEKRLFMDTIKLDPNSTIGIDSGRILIDEYRIDKFDI